MIGKDSRFKSLEVGISPRVNGGEGTTLKYLSHNGPDSTNPPEYDPVKVFDRLFGAGFTAAGGYATPVVDATLALRKSVLDAVLVDLTACARRVSTADKVRLDQHTGEHPHASRTGCRDGHAAPCRRAGVQAPRQARRHRRHRRQGAARGDGPRR